MLYTLKSSTPSLISGWLGRINSTNTPGQNRLVFHYLARCRFRTDYLYSMIVYLGPMMLSTVRQKAKHAHTSARPPASCRARWFISAVDLPWGIWRGRCTRSSARRTLMLLYK